MPSALGPQRSRLADDPAPVARWRVDFTTSDVRPRALATLPEGLTLTRASTATFSTSATATDSAAANEACLSRSTDYVASQGLLVRPTSGPRAADRLYVAASSVLDGGRLALEVTLLPAYSPTGYGYSPRLWTTDAGDYAEIDHSTGRLVVSIDGDSWSPTAALSWTAGQAVTLRVEAGGGTEYSGASYAVAGGAPVDLGTSTSVQAALAPTTIVLLCNGTSRAFEGTVRTLSAWTQAQSAAAPVTFDPSDLSPFAWYDADGVAGSDGDPAPSWNLHGLAEDMDIFVADTVLLRTAAIGGFNAYEFDGARNCAGITYPTDVPATCTIYWVWSALTGSGTFFDRETTPAPVAYNAGTGHLTATAGGATLSVAIDAAGPYWGGVVFAGASSRLRALTSGGVVEATGNAGTASAAPVTMAVDSSVSTDWLTARFACVLIFARALDATERTNLEAWLATRYGL